MGIYIKDQVLPPKGEHYLLQINSDGTVYDAVGRRTAAHAVPVIPHGRLIDASEEIQVQMYDDQHEDFYQVKMTIDDLLSQSWIDAKAPTVIPEEEGET